MSKKISVVFLFFGLLISSYGWTSSIDQPPTYVKVDEVSEAEPIAPPLEIYLDLDDTLVYSKSRPNPGTTFRDPENYELVHGCIEFLEYVARLESVKITFFSAGLEERNLLLAEHLMNQVDERLGRKVEYSVLSRRHMSQQPWGTPKKDLAAVGANLERAIIIDDSHHVIEGEQKSNWVGLYPGHNTLENNNRNRAMMEFLDFFFARYPGTSLGMRRGVGDISRFFDSMIQIEFDQGKLTRLATHPMLPRKMEVMVRNNLVRTLGLIVKLMDQLEQSPSHDIRPTLRYVQALNQGRTGPAFDQQLVQLGWSAIRTLNPDFMPWSHPTSSVESTPSVTLPENG